MRKKKFLSILCFLLILTFLPFGVFAAGTDNDSGNNTTVTNDEPTEAEKQAVEDEFAAGDMSNAGITVIEEDGKIYFQESGQEKVLADTWIQNKVKADMIAEWGNITATETTETAGDNGTASTMFKILKLSSALIKKITDADKTNYTKKTYEVLLKSTEEIIARLKNIENLITEGIKLIIGELNSTKVKSMLDEVYNAANGIETTFFSGSQAESLSYLNIYTSLLNKAYQNDSERGQINLRLHQLYSNNLDIDPASGQSFGDTKKDAFYQAMLNFGAYLDGSNKAYSGTNAYALYHAVLACDSVFNSQTFTSREQQYEALNLCYEKNYILCMMAMAYDQSLQEKALTYKNQAIAICNDQTSATVTAYTDKLKADNDKHTLAIAQDRNRRDELSARYKKIIDEQGGTTKSIYNQENAKFTQEKADAAVSDGHPGKLFCYYDGKYYNRTLYNMSAYYGRETLANETKARNLLKYHEKFEWSGTYCRKYLVIDGEVKDELKVSDIKRTDFKFYNNVLDQQSTVNLNSYCTQKGTTLMKAMRECFYISDNDQLTNAQAFSTSSANPEIYLDGYQYAQDVEVKEGCNKYIQEEFRRKVTYMAANGSVGSYDNVIQKRWKYGMVEDYDEDYGLYINNLDNTHKFVALRYADGSAGADALGGTYSWTKGDSTGLTIRKVSNIQTVTIDDNAAAADQWIYNMDAGSLTLKISLLQSLSVGTHTLCITDSSDDDTLLSLKIENAAITSLNHSDENLTAGDYVVDYDSLIGTIRNYEDDYSNQTVSIRAWVKYDEDYVSEEDMAKIKESAGSNTCVFADVSLAVYADGEYKGLVDEEKIANPVKISVYCPDNLLKSAQILRVHDGELTALTTEKNAVTGEGITVDTDNQIITVEASKFSTYALVYETSPATGLINDNPALFVILGVIAVTIMVGVVLLINRRKMRA